MNKYEKLLEELNNLYKKINDNNIDYKYILLKKIDDETYKIDKEYIKNYTSSRKGYEKWKEDNKNLIVDYAGKISFRKIFNKNKEIGAFLEQKISKKQDYDNNINSLLNTFFEIMEVKDIHSVKAYIENELQNYIYSTDWNAPLISCYIKLLKNIINNYIENEEFKIFFDKLKN